MSKSPEQQILELEAKVKLLKKQNAQLERQNYINLVKQKIRICMKMPLQNR